METSPPRKESYIEEEQPTPELEHVDNQKAVRLAWANFISILVAALAATASVLLEFFVTSLSDLGRIEWPQVQWPQFHWMVPMVMLNVIYVGISLGVVAYIKVTAPADKGGWIAIIFSIPTWLELRNFGDQRVARISYAALLAIPLAAYFIVENPLQIKLLSGAKLPLNTKISFFIAFFFSFALITFSVGCPKEFHRKSAFAEAKTVNMVLTSVEQSIVNVRDEPDVYDSVLESSKLGLRSICWLFYSLGLWLSAILLMRTASFVLNS